MPRNSILVASKHHQCPLALIRLEIVGAAPREVLREIRDAVLVRGRMALATREERVDEVLAALGRAAAADTRGRGALGGPAPRAAGEHLLRSDAGPAAVAPLAQVQPQRCYASAASSSIATFPSSAFETGQFSLAV